MDENRRDGLPIAGARDPMTQSFPKTVARSHSDENFFGPASAPIDSTGLTHMSSTSISRESGAQQPSLALHKMNRPVHEAQAESYRSHPRFDLNVSASTYRPSSASSYDSLSTIRHGANGPIEEAIASPQGFPQVVPLSGQSYTGPQAHFPGGHSNFTVSSAASASTENTANYDPYSHHNIPSADAQALDHSINGYQNSLWNTDTYTHSPRDSTDDFVNLLLSHYPQALSPGGPRQSSFGGNAFMEDDMQFNFGFDMMNSNGNQSVPQQHPMALHNILDPTTLYSMLSEEKRQELLKMIDARFNDVSPVSQLKAEIFSGDRDVETHCLSLRKMQIYIGSYWYHFHPQMPILHKPTFTANKAPNLLLIAVMAIGASCLDKVHGPNVTDAGADLANFLAWHLRGEIFKDKDFSPPAQLWIFQTLLLLEIYEKMFSTRVLHERAHIHHGTTLTLMRRGSSLIGRSPLDSPHTEKPGMDGSRDQSSSLPNKPEQWWHHWIISEATRRVAFAAFIIDTIHATMFGHQATMVAHEIKLALPCDESLWAATTSAEVAKKEADLRASGVKSMTFFDGLKNTLKSKPVQTNPFGRTAIMAGLLSVTWHLNQRDVQIHHLGALKALVGKDIWRTPLTKAFDTWETEFEKGIIKDSLNPGYAMSKFDEENIFESRVVLKRLSHMAMHVDIVTCQIFAGAPSLLGRTTLQADYDIAEKRIRLNWAPRAGARHATFHAIRFLAQVLMPSLNDPYSRAPNAPVYSARDDVLLNRPWVLYYAMLVVWSYGYALDGPLKQPPRLTTPEEKAFDARNFLLRFGNIPWPQDLTTMSDRNTCLGLLYVLQEKFKECRWELLQEAAKLLGNCIDKLLSS